MVTKRQHYYPRCLIKHFSNDDGKLYAYIRLANKTNYVNYQTVCSENYTYEGSSGVDNKLENEFSTLESGLTPIIEKIFNTFSIVNNKFVVGISEDEIDFLYKYIRIQIDRTDTGRINFVRSAGNFNYTQRKYPFTLEEIKNCKNKEILEFNDRFKKSELLERYFGLKNKPNDMNFHLVIGENFITSDNPVVIFNDGKEIYMPISQNLCLLFQHDSLNCSKEVIVQITKEKNKYINESQIETANYYVLSKEKFDISTNIYIYRRFHEKNWEKKSRHFK